MGIDIYARWRTQTEEEHTAQIRGGFSTVLGSKGYLREAYHGGPYVTKFLLREAFDPKQYGYQSYVRLQDGTVIPETELTEEQSKMDFDFLGVPIEVKKLHERLPVTVMMALYREWKVYANGKHQSWMMNLEQNDMASIATTLEDIFNHQIQDTSHEEIAASMTPSMLAFSSFLIDEKKLPDFAMSFVDFVALCEEQEKQNGELCYIYASW